MLEMEIKPGPRRDCSIDGHDWEPAPDGSPAKFVCEHCPAIGGECPERPLPAEDCNRCHGTGVVELVEIAASEVAELRRERDRFVYVARELMGQRNPTLATFRHAVDEMICLGVRHGNIRGKPVAAHGKTPARRRGRVGVSGDSGNAPVSVRTETNIADSGGKA